MTTTLAEVGERALVERLTRRLPKASGMVVVGPGDDCAVVRLAPDATDDLVLTSDPVIEGVHVRHDDPPGAVGHKAMARALSDLAAMGADPLWGLIDLVAPAATCVARVEAIYDGAQATAARYGLAIVGGDCACGKALELHVFAAGRVPRGTAVLRSTSHDGEDLYVTGALGGSLAGRHLHFLPRIKEGAWLRAQGWATAMMDLSDGLGSDLPRLCTASHVGAKLLLEALPVAPEVFAHPDVRAPVAHALYDGEDFELLFSVAAERRTAFEAAWQATFGLACSRIGSLTAATEGVRSLASDGTSAPLAGGYEHFQSKQGVAR